MTVETPLGGLQGFPGLETVWLNDPDGVTDYFYQMNRPPGRAGPGPGVAARAEVEMPSSSGLSRGTIRRAPQSYLAVSMARTGQGAIAGRRTAF